MQIEISDTPMGGGPASISSGSSRVPTYGLRWTAIWAGLVVGLATHFFLMLVGAAVGLAAFDLGAMASNRALPVGAAIWNTVSMVIAAFAGGYVAARSSNLRRTGDGVLHGVVAWGVTLLLSIMLASLAAGSAVSSAMDAASPRAAGAAADAARSASSGNRQAALAALQQNLGISAEQAGKVLDYAMIAAGREDSASPTAREDADRALHAASLASGWLSLAVLFSLLAAIGGGYFGARSSMRRASIAVQHRARNVAPAPVRPAP